jgi:hypothetical protein
VGSLVTFDDVSAVLVTRGDVDLDPIIETLPYGETVIWDNSQRPVDYGVFGRYVAIAETSRPLVYFQDDDCLVSCHDALMAAWEPGYVVGNAFDDAVRLAKYEGTTLLGWGAVFEADLPWQTFTEYGRHFSIEELWTLEPRGLGAEIVFPMLAPSKTITHGVTWLEEDDGPVLERTNRMWKQPTFYADVQWWMNRARKLPT